MIRSQAEKKLWEQGRRDGSKNQVDLENNSNVIYRDGWRAGRLAWRTQ